MITSSEIVPNAKENSVVGSNDTYDRYFALQQLNLLPTAPGIQYALEPKITRTPNLIQTNLIKVDVIGDDIQNLAITAIFGEEEPVQLPYVAFFGDKRIASEPVNTESGGLVLLFDEKKVLRSSLYIHEVGWNSLSVKLFIRGEHSEAFELIHTVPTYGPGTHPDIQIWKINYPENITIHPKYLSAGPIAEARLKKYLERKKQKNKRENRTNARQ